MSTLENSLNDLIVTVYRSLERLEEAMLKANKTLDLSISEIHLLEAVAACGSEDSATISAISEYQGVSLPSITSAVNKLVRKGFVTKEKCSNDGRVVRVKLTTAGRRAERAHRYFHYSMVHSVTEGLTDDERQALLKGIGKLNDFLDINIKKYQKLT